jgi:hypothetical protein
MNRFTDCEKWRDSWFVDLTPHAKLLFIYIVENCNNAGIYEINKKLLPIYLGITTEELKSVITELNKSYLKSSDGKLIWIKNFLKHQKKLPLNENNKAHKQIINILIEAVSNENKFSECDEMKLLLPESVRNDLISFSKTTVRFKPPKVEDVIDYMKSENFILHQSEGERFHSYFVSNGWKVGKNKMVDWKASVKTWINNYYARNDKFKPNSSKIKNIIESNEDLDNTDYNERYN